MLVRVLKGVLNGVIVFAVLLIIAVILGMVDLAPIGAIIDKFAWIIAVLVGVLTYFGVIPDQWTGLVK